MLTVASLTTALLFGGITVYASGFAAVLWRGFPRFWW
jgi:hypothetical protein